MKYAAEMCSGSMMFIPRFIKIGSGMKTVVPVLNELSITP
jgi:hypothetical protein